MSRPPTRSSGATGAATIADLGSSLVITSVQYGYRTKSAEIVSRTIH